MPIVIKNYIVYSLAETQTYINILIYTLNIDFNLNYNIFFWELGKGWIWCKRTKIWSLILGSQ